MDRELDSLSELDNLAVEMNECEWQRGELARVKEKSCFKVSQQFMGTLQVLCCANLYSFTSVGQLGKSPAMMCPLYRAISSNFRKIFDCTKTIDKRVESRKSNEDGQIGSVHWRRQRSDESYLEELNLRVFGHKRRLTKACVVSRFIFALFVLSLLGSANSIYNQYIYDYYSFHSRRLKTAEEARFWNVVELYNSHNLTQASLAESIEQAYLNLKRAGSPLIRYQFIVQCTYILMSGICIVDYLMQMLYFRYMYPLDFYYVRLLLNWDLEQWNCNKMIEKMVIQVARSSKDFVYASLDWARLDGNLVRIKEPNYLLGQSMSRRRAIKLSQFERSYPITRKDAFAIVVNERVGNVVPSLAEGGKTCEKDKLANAHRWTVRKLKQLALTGCLQPLDRCDPNWIASHALLHSSFVLFICLSCFVWNALLFHYLPILMDLQYENDFMDLLSASELGLQNVVLTLSGSFYLSLILVNSNHQMRIVKLLGEQIKRLIQTLEELSQTTEPGEGAQWEEKIDEIGTNLLYIVMHYKIFVAQSRPSKKAFGFISLAAIGLMVLFPILVRFHLPYLQDKGFRNLGIIVCFIMFGLPDLCILPLCRSNTRCIQLYKQLGHLMAHIIEAQYKFNQQLPINEHIVWLLRKELNHPERTCKQFVTVSTIGVVISYTGLLKLHFWMGLVIVSLCNEYRSFDTLNVSVDDSSFLNDPLGIITKPFRN